jgi:hypothetical protein
MHQKTFFADSCRRRPSFMTILLDDQYIFSFWYFISFYLIADQRTLFGLSEDECFFRPGKKAVPFGPPAHKSFRNTMP